jgi:hypothetical protein
VAHTGLLTRRVNGLHRFETIIHKADEQVSVTMNARNTNRSRPGAAPNYLSNVMLESALNFR